MRYIPATAQDVQEMLAAVGIQRIEELFEPIPSGLRLDRALNLPAGLSEPELVAEMEHLSRLSRGAAMVSYLGGGAYSHYIPAVVDAVISRSEFLTAYTPYQPEIAQGTLQAIFQMQTYVCELMAMEVSNASMYDASTAVAEAVLMARRMMKKYSGPERVLVSAGLNPDYRQVLGAYVTHNEMQLETVPVDPVTGRTDLAAAARMGAGGTVALLVQSPNHYGVIEDLAAVRQLCTDLKANMIVAVAETLSLGLLKAPGSFGADIVVGEGQPLGIPLSFGGPYCGLFTCRMADVRSMPGRLVGQTTDVDGQRGFVLTLNTREQHIRREKATSNICTNAGLMALAFTTWMSLVGKQGLPQLAQMNLQRAHYLKRAITKIPGLELAFSGPTFNEFVVKSNRIPGSTLLSRLEEQGIIGGLPLAGMDNCFLMAVTETNSRRSMDETLATLAEVVS